MRLPHGACRCANYRDAAGVERTKCQIETTRNEGIESMREEKHVLTMLVDNQPGVLSRVANLFTGRGYNIESLCVAPTINPEVSRITLVTKADLPALEQIEKQLRKLINVIKLRDLTGKEAVKREMALICVNAKPAKRAEILRIVDIFRCKVVDVGLEHYIIEVSGDEEKLNALIKLLKPMGIKKIGVLETSLGISINTGPGRPDCAK